MGILFLRLGAECLREFDDLLIVPDGQDTAFFAAATFICLVAYANRMHD